MDKQEYLDQLSGKTRPAKAPGKVSGILKSKFLWLGVGAVVLFITFAIIGGVISSNKSSDKTKEINLKLHLDNTVEVISDYQKNLKSSEVRSNAASLSSVLSNTSRDLGTYLEEKYNFKDKDAGKEMTEQAKQEAEKLSEELFKAKINGMLDKVFSNKMAYEISIIASEEASIINSTSDSGLKDLLTTSYNSLDVLYNKFNDYAEAN